MNDLKERLSEGTYEKIYSPENTRTTLWFHSGHVSTFFQVTQRTVYNWIKSGFIKGRQRPDRAWLFSLDEINRIRELKQWEPLTEEEAREAWEVIDKLGK